MSLGSARYQLASAFKTLQGNWDATHDGWRDAVRDEFERQHWDHLAARVPMVLSAMDRLDQVLARLREDCS